MALILVITYQTTRCHYAMDRNVYGSQIAPSCLELIKWVYESDAWQFRLSSGVARGQNVTPLALFLSSQLFYIRGLVEVLGIRE